MCSTCSYFKFLAADDLHAYHKLRSICNYKYSMNISTYVSYLLLYFAINFLNSSTQVNISTL